MAEERATEFRRILLHSRGAGIGSLLSALPQDRIQAEPYSPDRLLLAEDEVAVVLLDRAIHPAIAQPPPEGIGEGAVRLGIVLVGDRAGAADPFWPPRVYFSLPESAERHHLARALRSVFRILEERTISARSRQSLALRTRDIELLNQIGVSLAAETDPGRLSGLILSRAREITQAEAGSLYVIEESEGKPRLIFKASQNDAVRLSFEEKEVALDHASLAGHVALTGKSVRASDVYRLDANASYAFNREFDLAHGYRTRSMLVVPMKNRDGRVVGVLQLMNRKRRVIPDVSTTAVIRWETIAFDEENEDVARSLAAQAAVALENARLTAHLRRLFEGFVGAAVTAIEQRDPTTSGHSERVASLTCELARVADRADGGPYAPFHITGSDLTALRYAAVLHDFGKVGVREWVLVKARKLPPGRREVMEERFETARASAAARIWREAASGRLSPEQVPELLARELESIDNAWRLILEADEPTVLPRERPSGLDGLCEREFTAPDGRMRRMLEAEEHAYLTISKGSLDEEERREIESHVTQTYRFLTRIPWTPDLARVPDLAYLHHEKLDGSGYPRGVLAAEIPPPVRMMTICDIYDALTAADRPYKRAVIPDRAIDILRSDAGRGALDSALLDLFVEARVYEATSGERR